jgi:putative metallohydrolase (TIGR04338 family)
LTREAEFSVVSLGSTFRLGFDTMSWLRKPKPRDVQRRYLYHAERQVSAFVRDMLPTVHDIETFVDDMLATRWLRVHFAEKVLDPITVLNGKHNRIPYARGPAISMPYWSRSKFIVIHEVAHVLCGRHYGRDSIAAHGAEFASLQVAMVSHFLGEQDGQELHVAFMRCGVEHTLLGDEWRYLKGT